MPAAQGKSYVVYFKKRAPIVVYVTPELATICDTSVTLTATIIGNTTNRAFLWEMIEGPPIVWLTPQDQPEVQWAPASALRQDRLFRFYVDKDDPQYREVYEVWCFGTPTDRMRPATIRMISGRSSNSTSINLGTRTEGVIGFNVANWPNPATLLTEQQLLSGLGSSTNSPIAPGFLNRHPSLFIIEREGISTSPNVPQTSSVAQSNNLNLMWLLPENQSGTTPPHIANYVVEESTDGEMWTVYGTYVTPRAIPVTTGNSYRVTVVYDNVPGPLGLDAVFSPEPIRVTSNTILAQPSIAAHRAFAVDNLQHTTSRPNVTVLSNYNVIERSLVSFSPPDEQLIHTEMMLTPRSTYNYPTDYNVIERSLVTYEVPTVEQLQPGIVRGNPNKIFNYTVSSGGTVGG